MSDNLSKLMHLEQMIIKFIDDNQDLTDDNIDERFAETRCIDKCIGILKRMSNNDILESLKRFEYMRMFIDFKAFLKKYTIDKKRMKEQPEECLNEYDKINKICETISEVSVNRRDFLSYLKILDIDSSVEWLLKHMPNEDLLTLSNRTGDWMEKLYYYSYFKA